MRWISQKTLYGQVFNRSEKFIMEYEHFISIHIRDVRFNFGFFYFEF